MINLQYFPKTVFDELQPQLPCADKRPVVRKFSFYHGRGGTKTTILLAKLQRNPLIVTFLSHHDDVARGVILAWSER